MKIAVCVKHVPISENVEIDENNNLVRDNAESDINPCDMNAMEFALQLKQQTEGTIDVYSMGPDIAMASLKKCLAVGADQAYLLSDRRFAGGDTLGTARVLAKALSDNGPYDVIFTGNESADGGTGQVGPMIAEIMNMPDVSETVSIEANGSGGVTIKKSVPDKHMILDVATPVLVTVPFGCNEPTLPTLRTQRQANRVDVPSVDDDQLGLDPSTIGQPAVLSVVTGLTNADYEGNAEMLEGSFTDIASRIGELIDEGRS